MSTSIQNNISYTARDSVRAAFVRRPARGAIQRLQLRLNASHSLVGNIGYRELSTERSDLDDALPLIPRPQKYWNAIELALLGDAVWEYYIRRHCLFPPAGIARARERMESLSSAENQADCLDRLESEWLTDSEEDLVRWALNAKWSKPLRTQKKRLPLLVYKRASALEVLVGDLHLSNPSRLNGMMECLGYGKPDISCLGTLSEDELHGRGWQSAS